MFGTKTWTKYVLQTTMYCVKKIIGFSLRTKYKPLLLYNIIISKNDNMGISIKMIIINIIIAELMRF